MNEEVPGATDEPRNDADAVQAEPARKADAAPADAAHGVGSDELALGASTDSARDPRAEAAPDEVESDEVAHGEVEEEDEEVAPRASSNGVAAITSDPADDEPQTGPTGARDWYILKVQSNREDSIREALERRIKIAGLEGYFGEIIVPIEKVTEFKGGKKRIIKRKLYPGYLVVHMELNDDTWFLVRETHGIGDFTGAGGKPTAMLPHEVNRILSKQDEKTEEAPKLKIAFKQGDRVKIREGTFENFEGDVDQIDEANGRVTVMINIFGRSTPVELEYWQIEAL